MHGLDTHSVQRATLPSFRKGAKPNYRLKLRRGNTLFKHTVGFETEAPLAGQVRALADHPEVNKVAYQCIAVAALQKLGRVAYREQRVADAAISLAQREKMLGMVAAIHETAEALQATLSPQGANLFGREGHKRPVAEAPETSWWFALAEAIHELEEGSAQMLSIVARQPEEQPARLLTNLVVPLFQEHYETLIAEAEHWMG